VDGARNRFAALREAERCATGRRTLNARALLDLHRIVRRNIAPNRGGRLLLIWQLLRAGFPFTVIHSLPNI
jgi:hypothetical protein